MACGHQFRSGGKLSADRIWNEYQSSKQTVAEIAASHGISESTVKRRLRSVRLEWVQPPLDGGGCVHLDVTYWGRNWGVMLAVDDATGRVLYMGFVSHETVGDYRDAIESIESRGYRIDGIVIDGMRSLFREFSAYKVQMCQFHMCQIVRRYLTRKPRMLASRELLSLIGGLTRADRDGFTEAYRCWKEKWDVFVNRRSASKRTGRSHYTHRRLKTTVNSIDFYLPYLFTFRECAGMPNTNNKIEGIFTDLKKNLNNHSGMSEENRKRFIIGFFKAWDAPHCERATP